MTGDSGLLVSTDPWLMNLWVVGTGMGMLESTHGLPVQIPKGGVMIVVRSDIVIGMSQ